MVRPRLSGLRQPLKQARLHPTRRRRNGEAAIERIETRRGRLWTKLSLQGRNGEAAIERIETIHYPYFRRLPFLVGMVRPRLSGLRLLAHKPRLSAMIRRNGEAAIERIETGNQGNSVGINNSGVGMVRPRLSGLRLERRQQGSSPLL